MSAALQVALAATPAPAPPVAQPAAARDEVVSSTQKPPGDVGQVTVVGRRESGSYYAGDVSGSKSGLAMRELPQAVRVLTAQALDDMGARRLDDTLEYVGGVSRQNNFGGLWDNVAIRGLPGNENTGSALLLNGFSANRGFNAPRDLAGIERVEFLKGPAAALYGSSEPGGTLNIVSKRPQRVQGNAVGLTLGNFGLKRVTLDSTGPLGEPLAYRVNAAWEDRDGWRTHVPTRRRVLAPALRWQPTGNTVIDYTGEWIEHRAPLDRGVTAVNGVLGRMDRRAFLGEPADGDVTVRNVTHQLSIDHQLNDTWNLRAAVAQRSGSLRGFSTEPTALQADGYTLRRQRRARDFSSRDVSLQGEVRGEFDAGLKHTLVAGIEGYRFHLQQTMLRVNPSAAAPYAIDILAPVYGQPQPTPLPNTQVDDAQRGIAVYVQDALHLGPRWRALVGVRHDRDRQTLTNLRNGVVTRARNNATSPRVGLTWLLNDALSVYATHGHSYRANAGADAGGKAFAPERARANELGLKFERADGALGATLAAFHITKRNVLTSDPANSGFSIAAGEVRSRGLEADVSGRIGPHLRINASFVHNLVDVTRDNTLQVGAALINVPRTTASLLGVYEWNTGRGVAGIGAGLTHVGARLGEARTQADARLGVTPFMLPSYTLTRALAYWRINPKVRVSADIDNLFDRTYYTSSVQRTWVQPGAPRTVSASVEVQF